MILRSIPTLTFQNSRILVDQPVESRNGVLRKCLGVGINMQLGRKKAGEAKVYLASNLKAMWCCHILH